jgi:hypothetical protein
VADDRDLPEAEGEIPGSGDLSNPDPVLTFTRREVLIGGGSAMLAGPVRAADARDFYIDVAYEDGTRRGLVIAWVEKTASVARDTGPPKQRFEWRLRASNFTDPELPNGGGRFVLRRTHEGWRAQIAKCAFPGGYTFGLTIEVKWDPAFDPRVKQEPKGPQPPSLTITLSRGTGIELSLNNLIDFLKAKDDTAVDEIAGQLTTSQVASLARRLFGDTFDAANARNVHLAFHHDFYWILRAGTKVTRGQIEDAAAKQNRFRALSDEGASLPFKEVFFTVFSGNTGDKSAKVFVINSDPAGKATEDVRALFAGDGAPPAPDSTLSKRTEKTARAPAAPNGAAAADPGPALNGDEAKKLAPRVLYALVKHDATQVEANPADKWAAAISLGRLATGESARLTIHESSVEAAQPSFLGWRNYGDNNNPVFALRVPWMTLAVRRADGAVASEFDDLNGLLWRAKGDDDSLRVVGSLIPTKRKMAIETRFGRFVAAPLPTIAPRPGVSARVPAIRIGGTGAKDRRTLNHFAAPLALEQAAIPLLSERLAGIARERAKGKDGSWAESAAERAAKLFSQLTFHEAECLFRIDKLPLRHVWKGTPAPTTDPPQAEAVVHVGAKPADDSRPPARLSLSRAALAVRRPSDLLALKYRFQDLVLEFREAGWAKYDEAAWWVTPDRRLAAFLPNGEPLPDPGVPLICDDKAPLANEPTRYQPRQDPRPLLVVEFPPQHIAERAYLRQLQADPVLPAPPPGTEVKPDDAEILRSGKLEDRKKKRTDIGNGQDAQDPEYKKFRDRFRDAVQKETSGHIPEDQQEYVGPGFLDLEAARVARRVARAIQSEKDAKDENLDTPEQRARFLRSVPEVQLSDVVIGDLHKKFPNIKDDFSEGYPEAVEGHSVPDEAKVKDYLEAREALRKQRDDDYKNFTQFYATPESEREKVPGLTNQQKQDLQGYKDLPGPFYGRRSTIARVEVIAKTNRDDAKKATRAIAATVAAFDLKNEVDDVFEIPTEARVSGSSRLVFRIPADDFEEGRPDNTDEAPAGAFPFTIEALTNWGAFDLAVVRRADKVFEPLAGSIGKIDKPKNNGNDERAPQIANGRLPPRWARQETRDEAAKLLYQGITRGDAWAVRHDEQRALDKVIDCPKPLARLGAVTGAQRMAEIAASVRPASLFETSIELPFRLMLSPAQDAAWRTPLGLPAYAGVQKNSAFGSAPVPLWFAQLDEAPGSSSVRAIWSPDFRPEGLLDKEVGAPPHGPWAPWAMAREVTALNPYIKDEPVYAPPGQTPNPATLPPERFRTGMDAGDRHELVALSSLHGLPVRGRRKPDGTLTDGSQINPPAGFKLRYAALESIDGDKTFDDYSAIYRPQPLGVAELTLTALGGSFDADTNFVPPASAKVVPVALWDPNKPVPGNALFDAFSVERWRQDTRLGRDIRVEVVYKGFLFPCGHRASLVKLTERRFMVGPGGLAAGPVAFLVQRFFLRIGTPIKTYPALAQPNGGRRWPVERLEILTRVTPDILDPTDAVPSGTDKWYEAASGRIYLRANAGDKQVLPGLVFWPRVRAREGGEVNFEMEIDARGARTRLPLIFVDNTAANDEGTMEALVKGYAELTDVLDKHQPDPRRVLQLGGGKRRYAPEKEPDGTSFETRQWVLEAEGREKIIPRITDALRNIEFNNIKYDFGALLQGVDQPPFYPVMKNAAVRIAQVDRMVGRPTGEIVVSFDAEYQAFGFPQDDRLARPANPDKSEPAAKTDVYLDFAAAVPLDPGSSGDRTGGAVRPNTYLVAMSRSRGPVGNKAYHDSLNKALAGSGQPASTGLDDPDPTSFFGEATVLGVIDLKGAIQFLIKGLSGTPQFKEMTQYTSALLTDLQETANADAGEAVAKVRDRLLIPMREALLTLARQFFDAINPGKESTFEEGAALERIERLYPDVGKSYRELADALDAAISSSQTVRDVEALLASFATIYGAGRRFLAAIERVANDPLAPVHEALRKAFNELVTNVIVKAAGLLENVVPDLNAFQSKLQTNLASLFSHADFAAWRHIVLALPGAHAIKLTPLGGQAKAVDDKVQAILARAASDSDFLGVLLTKGPDQAAADLRTKFAKYLNDEIGPGSTDLQKALKAAADDWIVAAGNEADQIKGLLYDAAMKQVGDLLAAGQNLINQGNLNIRNVIGNLASIATAALKLIEPMVDAGLAQAVTLCKYLAGIVKSVADAVNLPDPKSVDDARTAMAKAFADAATAFEKINLDPQPVKDVAKALDDGVEALVKVRDALRRALDELLALKDDICSATPERYSLDAFAALARMRETLTSALNNFNKALGSARALNKFVAQGNPRYPGGDLKSLLAKITGSGGDYDKAKSAVVDAAKAAAKVAAALSALARDATALRTTDVNGALKKVRDDLAAIGNAKLNDIIAIIDGAKDDAIALRAQIDQAIKDITDKVGLSVPPDQAGKYLDELFPLVLNASTVVDDIKSKIVQALEQKVLEGVGAFVVAGEPYLKQMVVIAFQGLSPVFSFLIKVQGLLVDERNKVWTALGGGTNKDEDGTIGDDLSAITFAKIRALLLVDCPKAPQLPRPTLSCSDPLTPTGDFLAAEKAQLDRLATAFSFNDLTKFDPQTIDEFVKLFAAWGANQGSAQLLLQQLANAAAAVLSGDLKRIVDLEGARRRIEEKIKELVPAKIVLNYDLHADLIDFPPVFKPRPDSQLTLSAGAVYDLLDPTTPPRFTASCRLDPFDINLFNVVTLIFSGAQFVNESGKGSDFNIVYKDFELGPNAEFLKPLQALMNPGGSGPYVRPSREVPGIEAGYSLDLGIISIGTVSFANVSINAACVLPFNGARATFVASIGREDRPVLLSIAPYTGGGFLALYADAQRLLGFAASFEFGGGGAFQFGPLSGQGRITTGIYLRKLTSSDGKKDDCVIEGFFYAGGEAHIACFAISATLVVRISHRSGGSMQGSAVFTFSFSIGFAKLRYQVGVQKSMGQGFSGGGARILRDLRIVESDDFIPTVSCSAAAMQDNWDQYQKYFARDVNGFPA